MANNNETTTKFKVDISELKKSMQEARKQVAYANSEFKVTASSMDDWSKSSDGISAKLKQLNSNLNSQETVLEQYEKTLEEVKREYGENSKEALEYATKLNNQQAIVNKTKKEIAGYEDALQEVADAEKIASKTGKDVADVLADTGNEAENAGDGFTVLKGAVAGFVGNALTQLVSGLKDAVTSLVSFSDEADKAMNSFQASTGATAEEMAEFEDTMKNIYKSNYGESFEDIADSMTTVKNTMGDWLGAEGLEILTKDALILRDTFDFEVSESMRAVNSLMNQFGIDGDYAFNLIAQGAQNGLNQNGDLLDVINEYSVQFAGAGYEAEDMFNMLANGASAGTWSVDKLGDAVKEFNIRMSDGSAKDAVEALGFSWESVSESWSAGGDEAKEVFNMLVNELDGLENTTEGYGIGVGLLGTMFEDLGFDAIYALSDIQGNFDMTKDSMAEIDSIKYDSVGDALAGLGRNLQTSVLMPIGDKLLPIVSDLAVKFGEWLNDPATQEGIQSLSDGIAEFLIKAKEIHGVIKNEVIPFIAEIPEKLKEIAPILATIGTAIAGIGLSVLIGNITSVMSAIKTCTLVTKAQTLATNAQATAQKLLNIVMNASPIGLIITLISTLVVAFIGLWNTSEEFRNFWINLWEKIKESCGVAKEWIGQKIEEIGKFFTETLPEFFTSIIDWVTSNWQSLLLLLINPFAGLFKYFYDNNIKFKEFVDTAINYIKQLPEKVWTWLVNTINKVNTWRNNMITKAKETALSFINKIIEFIQTLPEKVWTWLSNVLAKVVSWGSNMVTKARETATSFVNKVIEYVKQLPEKVWTWLSNVLAKVVSWGVDLANKGREAGQKLFNGIVDTVKGLPEKFLSIGSDIISGLWNGISGAIGGLYDKIKESLSGLVDKAKDALGIHSPSKVFADEVGKWIPEGIAVGISKNAKSALNAMKNLTVDSVNGARADLSTSATATGGLTSGGVVNNFYQTINSPKQLSRLDIYRQSKNLLGYVGGV